MPPAVQTLEQIIAELEPAYAQTAGLYNTQKAGLGAKYDAQRAGVEGKKVQGFTQIGNSANSRGLDFWGIPIEEQSQYLADVYLPGMMQANNQQNEEGMQIDMNLAGLNKERRLRASDTLQSQQSARAAFEEAERDRAFQAEQARLQREAAAREAAASRSHSSASSRIPKSEMRAGVIAFLDAGRGKDKRVSPERYLQAKATWLDEGGSAQEFDSAFRSYINESHAWSYGFGSKPGSSKARSGLNVAPVRNPTMR